MSSLCMIARNNQDCIARALSSIRPWVDEMIVVRHGLDRLDPANRGISGGQAQVFPVVRRFLGGQERFAFAGPGSLAVLDGHR